MKLWPDRPWPDWFGIVNALVFFGSPFLCLFLSTYWGEWVLIPWVIIMLWVVMGTAAD